MACGASGSRRPWIAVLGTELSTPGRAGLRPTGRSRAQPWHISSSAAMVDQKGRACIGAPDIRRTKPRHDVNADKRGNRYPVRLGGSSKGAALSFSRKRVVSSGRTMAGGRLVAASRRGGAGTALCQGTPAASVLLPGKSTWAKPWHISPHPLSGYGYDGSAGWDRAGQFCIGVNTWQVSQNQLPEFSPRLPRWLALRETGEDGVPPVIDPRGRHAVATLRPRTRRAGRWSCLPARKTRVATSTGRPRLSPSDSQEYPSHRTARSAPSRRAAGADTKTTVGRNASIWPPSLARRSGTTTWPGAPR